MRADVSEGPYVLVLLLLAVAEVEQVEADLALGQLDAGVDEEAVGGGPEVDAVHTLLRRGLVLRRLQLWVTQDGLADLEEHHLAADSVHELMGALQSRHEDRLDGVGAGEVVREVVEQVEHEVVTLLKID